ncbi:MAG: hypothetical protein CME64_06095 [Halobacteriovoraceae bacterium]|nr:hypothetical protein [Halobacteriovoraceae bacterium]|tara:strand:+ start:125690 stop:125986 length:297 start_codon:yes stop_codon:yes gene_type:complete
MQTEEYLRSVENRIDLMAKDLREISAKLNETVNKQSTGVEGKAKDLIRQAESKVAAAKGKIQEYGLKKDLAVEEAKGGMEMATEDLKETFNSIKKILQ